MTMHMHPVTAEMLGAAHRADLQAEASTARLVREARAASATRSAPTVSLVAASRRRLVATLLATLMALGIVAGSVGATPTAKSNAAPAPAAADHPMSGGGIHLQR